MAILAVFPEICYELNCGKNARSQCRRIFGIFLDPDPDADNYHNVNGFSLSKESKIFIKIRPVVFHVMFLTDIDKRRVQHGILDEGNERK